MADIETMSVRKLVSMAPSMAQAIDDYRFGQRIKSEAEAIRALIRAGLKATKPVKP